MMVLSFAACGGDTPPADTGSDVPQVSDDTPPADSEELTYTLDYETIAGWVDAGFIGIDESGAPIVMAIDAAKEEVLAAIKNAIDNYKHIV